MKQKYDIIMFISILISFIGTIFFNFHFIWVAAIVIPVLINIITEYADIGDRIGISIVGFLLVLCFEFFIWIVAILIIDSKNIVLKEYSYKIELLQNETIVYNTDKRLEIENSKELYYKCKLENCTHLVKQLITEEPVNNIFAKNIFFKQYFITDIK